MQDAVKEAIKAFFKGDDNIRLVFLFGSMARGTAHPGSDADVAVLFAAPPSSLELLELRASLEEHLRRDADLISLNSAGPIIKMQVLKTGIQILGRKRDYEEFFVRTVNEYHDFKQIIAPLEEAVLRRRIYG
ncbi:MAG: type VII toxin-antitoxin system MntA family adenylyltransferase antitoxin [Aminivibrio sp.]